MRWFHSLAAAVAVATLSPAIAKAQTKIDFFFPVPVDGKLAKELQRLTKVYNDSQKDVAVTPVYAGNYDDAKLKAQAAAAAGKPPAVALMSANYLLDLKISGDIISLQPMLQAEGLTREKFLDDFLAGAACQRDDRRRALRRAPTRTRRRCSITTRTSSRRSASIPRSHRRPGPSWSRMPRSSPRTAAGASSSPAATTISAGWRRRW